MGRFIFTYEGELFEGPEKSITLEVGEGVSRDDLLNEIQNFLRSAGYYFSENSYLDIVTPDEFEQPELNEWRKKNWTQEKWVESNWIQKSEDDVFPQKDGQQWQSNGWDTPDDGQIDGPTEFAFNGIKEKDFPEIKLDLDIQAEVNKMVDEMNKGFYKREG